MNNGTTFSGYWYGPKLFDERVMTTGTPCVRQYDRARRSPAALEAEYGFDGRTGSCSVDEPCATLPYTSSVLTCRNRGTRHSRTASSRVKTPKTSVRRKPSGS